MAPHTPYLELRLQPSDNNYIIRLVPCTNTYETDTLFKKKIDLLIEKEGCLLFSHCIKNVYLSYFIYDVIFKTNLYEMVKYIETNIIRKEKEKQRS